MNNEKDHEKNGQSKAEGSSPKDDIPLWLQGLEEPNPKNSKTTETDSETKDTWDREDSQETYKTPTTQNHLADFEESENGLPDWLNELSRTDSEPAPVQGTSNEEETDTEASGIDSAKGFSTEDEKTNEVNIKNLPPDEIAETYQKPTEESPIEEGFIEISEADLDEFSEPDLRITGEKINEDEELPQWLQEMITEPPETTPQDLEEPELVVDSYLDEPTEPVVVRAETEYSKEDHLEQAPLENEALLETPQEISKADQIPEMPINDDPTPVPTEIEVPIHQPEMTESERTQPAEVPKTLRFAKNLLDQGDYHRAMDIINTYIERTVFLDEIHKWLVDIVQDGASNHNKVWESIGDIALKRGKPKDALQAYTKAIKCLLNVDRDNHETG